MEAVAAIPLLHSLVISKLAAPTPGAVFLFSKKAAMASNRIQKGSKQAVYLC
jgi:hypothetical protein